MPASCVPYAPEAQGSLPWEGTAVRAPYAFQPRACRAYRTLWRHRLHETSDGRKAQAHPPRAGQCAFRRRWRTWLDSESGARARLNAMFRAFVEGEVARHFGEPVVYQARCHTCHGHTYHGYVLREPVVHQADPTLRVHIAGTGRALGVPHVDADYFHQALTPCSHHIPRPTHAPLTVHTTPHLLSTPLAT